MTEDMNDNVLLCTESFLTAEELVDLRKPADEPVRQLVGDKFSIRTDLWLEEEAVKHSLANLKDVLKQKRAARQCDLIQAEWVEEQNAALTTKLKGKYVHHMGHTVDGKIALSPEESMFLLENGAIEIMNGEAPMSTEEGFAVILKGKLAIEKYRVYSHLAQLGFIVVPHQKRLDITRYEKLMNLDKHPVKKRKGSPVESQGSNKKRLTFTGALCEDSKASTSLNNSYIQVENTLPVESEVYENKDELEVCEDDSISEVVAEASIEDTPVDTSAQETTIVVNVDNEEMSKSLLGPSSLEESNSHNVDPLPNLVQDVIACQNKETEEVDPKETFGISVSEEETKGDEQCLSSREICCDIMEEGNEVEIDQQIEVEDAMKGQCETHDSASCNEFQSTYEHENLDQHEIKIDSPPATEVSSKNDIDIMEVDSQDTEISCSSSESSSDEDDANNSANPVSQDSFCAVVDSQVKGNNVNGYSSGYRLNRCSSSLSYTSELLLHADSRDSLLSRNELQDDEITLIEVTKKETKPLAVIDLLSGGEESSSEPNMSDSDDEISILKVCSAPSGNSDTRIQAGEVNSRKLNGFKKEEMDSPVQTPKLQVPALRVHFPDLHQKGVVCVARPPLHLLPNHVNPSKEAYILDLNAKNNHQQSSQSRVWDSYKTMQEYQSSRRLHHQSFSEYQGRDNRGQPLGMPRLPPDAHQGLGNRQPSLLGNPSQRVYGSNPYESSWEPNPPSRFPPPHSMSNPFMNSMMSIQQQNTSVMGNQSFPPMGSMFHANVPLPNIANLPPSQMMSEVQRTAVALARNMLSQMFNPPNNGQPMPPFNPFTNANGCGPPNHNTLFNSYNNQAFNDNGYPDFMANNRRGFGNQQRRHTGRPFPCHFRRAGNKQSWETVKEAVGGDKSDDSDIEEVPITSTEVLWDQAVLHPLVKAGEKYEKNAVLNSLLKTHMAKLNKRSLDDKCFEDTGSLEVAFDVYLPGCNYRKTNPSIPKHRVIVVKVNDSMPRYSELAYIQCKWNDGASLQIAIVDHGDVSFMAFSSDSVSSLIPCDL